MITINFSTTSSDANLREALVSQIEDMVLGFEKELNEGKSESDPKESIHYNLTVEYSSKPRGFWPQGRVTRPLYN